MDLETFLAGHVRGSGQHKQFYHFTDRKNIDSIRERGLLCTSELRRLGLLENVTTGGDTNSLNSDRQKGTDQFVCLCFTDNHPMSHIASVERNLSPVYLKIDPEVIKLPGVMITNAASNQNGVARQNELFPVVLIFRSSRIPVQTHAIFLIFSKESTDFLPKDK
jgi:hypothetical protein